MALINKIKNLITNSQLAIFFRNNKELIFRLFMNWGKTKVILAYFTLISLCLGLSILQISWNSEGISLKLEFSAISFSTLIFIGIITVPIILYFKSYRNSDQVMTPSLFEKIYLPVFTELFNILNIKDYENWTYFLAVSGDTRISSERYYALDSAITYIEKRITINEYASFNMVMQNLKSLLSDLSDLLGEHLKENSTGMMYFDKFYKLSSFNPDYEENLKEYKASVMLIADLTFEMTRILNFLLDKIREIKPDFLVNIGSLVIHDTGVVKYQLNEEPKYPGLENFKQIVHTRTPHISNYSI